jgi:protein-tyrosine phosphatase
MTVKASVLFVCLGNICRSPTADGVFRHLVSKAGLDTQIHVDSSGTIGSHAGDPPDHRMQKHAKKRGYDLSVLRGRKFVVQDFEDFDYILAMDQDNYAHIKDMEPRDSKALVQLMGEYYDHSDQAREVPDPYYGGADGFEQVLDMVEKSCEGLLKRVCEDHKL